MISRQGSLLRVVLSLAVVLVLAGCAGDDGGPIPTGSGESGSSSAPQLLSCPPAATAVPLHSGNPSGVAVATVRSYRGGWVKLGNLTLQIPAYALTADATITIRQVDSERVIVQIEPQGLRLLKPAVLRWDDLDGWFDSRRYETVTVLRKQGNDLTPIPTDKGWDAVEAQVTNLGTFALGGGDADGQQIELLRYLSGPGYSTEYIRADLGGTVSYYRYAVQIPPGALSEDTYITVRDAGTIYVMCDLEPHGIQFNVPVRFEINLLGLQWQPYTDWSDYWLNERTGEWERQDGQFIAGFIVDYLDHFSRYAAGRAGW